MGEGWEKRKEGKGKNGAGRRRRDERRRKKVTPWIRSGALSSACPLSLLFPAGQSVPW